MRSERSRLGCECYSAPGKPCEEQGFFAQSIPPEKQPLAVLVPQGESEHADETVERHRAPRLDRLEKNFSVAMGGERVAAAFEVAPDFSEVVDLSVVDQQEPPRSIQYGLIVGGAQIDDRRRRWPERRAGR
jgi:hypothetical protein